MNIAALLNSIEMGMICAGMALGVYITFRVLNFPDLTVDGSFVTGAAVTAVLLVNGVSPIMSSLVSLIAGFIAGLCTGILHTKGKINPLLSGILMMIALYSINMHIMGKPNLSLRGHETVFTDIPPLVLMPVVVLIIKILLDLFLHTDLGLALRATGDNPQMIRSLGANTDMTKILGISLSNGLVALSGALIAQQSGFADISMGIGMIVIGLASVIIGEAIFGAGTVVRATLAVIFGSVIYRFVVALALQVQWFDASDLKLITALIVIVALVVPTLQRYMKQRKVAQMRSQVLLSSQDSRLDGES